MEHAAVAHYTQRSLIVVMNQFPLFQESSKNRRPLAFRLAPLSWNDYIGHASVVGPDKPLRKMIDTDRLASLIFWGPPGCGKTSLARLISRTTRSECIALNAVQSKLSDIKAAIDSAKAVPHQRTIVFIDEIHRFSKTQQDALLPDVERGVITLIGATTENPFFSVIPGLLSRCQVIELSAYSSEDMEKLLKRALKKSGSSAPWTPDAVELAIRHCGGDARKLLNLVDYTLLLDCGSITDSIITDWSQSSGIAHTTDAHYDLISALIKSMRASDPDAALYWLARLLRGGEDPRFIARRLVVFASEDIGNADPSALALAVATFTATETIGMPEIRITLGQAVIFCATAPKSNACYSAINAALEWVDQGHIEPVPPYLRSPSTAKNGITYDYPHRNVPARSPQPLWSESTTFYTPKPVGHEARISAELSDWAQWRLTARRVPQSDNIQNVD